MQSRNRLRLSVTARRSAPHGAYVESVFAADRHGVPTPQPTPRGQPPPHGVALHTGHIGLGIHASMIFALAFLLATLALVFAAAGSADDEATLPTLMTRTSRLEATAVPRQWTVRLRLHIRPSRYQARNRGPSCGSDGIAERRRVPGPDAVAVAVAGNGPRP